jgi:galactose mutarotase-like enzyme
MNDAQRPVTLDNGEVRVSVLPALGGKLISIKRLASGTEFLLPPPEPERDYRRAQWGDRFEDYDTSGFDECFPTVARCDYPRDPFRGRLPDHGELWSATSEYQMHGYDLVLWAHGRQFPYEFRRTLRLRASALEIEYEIKNLSDNGFHYLWSAHPLLQLGPGGRILLPPEAQELSVYWSKNERLGRRDARCAFPLARVNGRNEDISRVTSVAARTADKLFTGRVQNGFCALYRPAEDESIVFRFEPESVPCIGIWICQGGWPEGRLARHFAVALEPCNYPSDSLEEAVARGGCPQLEARSSRQWRLQIELCSGMPTSTQGLTRETDKH